MLRQVLVLALALVSAAAAILPADAQSFASRNRRSRQYAESQFIYQPKTSFEERVARFRQDLGEAGERMKILHARTEALTAQRFLTESKSIQVDTGTNAQNGFVNSQIHARNSGGLYNTPANTTYFY